MPIQLIPQNLIDPNPFDSRILRSQADVDAKAASIKAHGLLQEPKGRAVMVKGQTRYQLAFGMTRFGGWKIAKPSEPFPVNVVELTDEEMSFHSFEENDKQNSLTQIEKARWIAKHMAVFDVKQAVLARALEKDDATVSNLLRLLQLPQAIQDLMLKGLPERLARQLIPLSKAHPREAVMLADKIFRLDESEREREFDREFSRVFWNDNLAKRLSHASFPPDWKPDALKVADDLEPKEATACKGCPFHTKHQDNAYCLRVNCFAAKQTEWKTREAVRVAEKLKITNATRASSGVTVIPIQWGHRAQLKAALATNDPALRIMAADSSDGAQLSEVEGVLGSKSVVLGAATLEDAKRIGKLAQAALGGAKGNPAQKKEDERSKKEQHARREAHDLYKRVAPQLALALFPLDVPRVVLDALFDAWRYENPSGHDKAVAAYKVNARETLALLFLYRGKSVPRWGLVNVAEVRKGVEALAKTLKIKLSAAGPNGATARANVAKVVGRRNAKAAKQTKAAKGKDARKGKAKR